MPAVIEQATKFLAAGYGQSNCATVSEIQPKSWAANIDKGTTSASTLSSLPPIIEALTENVKLAHIQASV